ncbi:MAG: FecR family protein [Syntrophales bacterium]|nr:FecR family protein [Syntrophales bacterium]MDD5234311.1 FecR family protein [Syntrophales bacterium]MDD5532487.1 FecR family protein [Syntrophales bacterium]
MKAESRPAVRIALAVLIIAAALAATADARPPMQIKIGRDEARVTVLEGAAGILPDGKTAWQQLRTGAALKGGDQVSVEARSRMEIRLADRSVMRFAENTRFRISKIDVSDGSGSRTASVNMVMGKTWANIAKSLGAKPNYEISSRNAVCGVRGTLYRMDVEDNQSVLVRVYEGEVSVSGAPKGAEPTGVEGPPDRVSGPVSVPGPKPVSMEEWIYIVKSMQQIRIGGDGIPQKPESFTESEDRDAWVDWNRALDRESNLPESTEKHSRNGFFDWFK